MTAPSTSPPTTRFRSPSTVVFCTVGCLFGVAMSTGEAVLWPGLWSKVLSIALALGFAVPLLRGVRAGIGGFTDVGGSQGLLRAGPPCSVE
jgi:hypothetical protein